MADISIFRKNLKTKLQVGEKVEADLGYVDELDSIRHLHVFISLEDQKAKAIARRGHETINGRLKFFNVLTHRFRHSIHKHKTMLTAVTTVVQASFDCGHKPFQCHY